jgi:hypothetical protein
MVSGQYSSNKCFNNHMSLVYLSISLLFGIIEFQLNSNIRKHNQPQNTARSGEDLSNKQQDGFRSIQFKQMSTLITTLNKR